MVETYEYVLAEEDEELVVYQSTNTKNESAALYFERKIE